MIRPAQRHTTPLTPDNLPLFSEETASALISATGMPAERQTIIHVGHNGKQLYEIKKELASQKQYAFISRLTLVKGSEVTSLPETNISIVHEEAPAATTPESAASIREAGLNTARTLLIPHKQEIEAAGSTPLRKTHIQFEIHPRQQQVVKLQVVKFSLFEEKNV